jgi:aromatase
MDGQRRELVHSRVVSASPAVLYDLVAEVTRWPAIFEPCLFVRHLERGGVYERFQIWAMVNNEVRTWTSRRTMDPIGRAITFEQEHSQAPIAAMSGEWLFRPMSAGRTELILRHDVSTTGGRPAMERVSAGLDANSQQELAAIARIAESEHPVGDLVFSFTDEVRLAGEATAAYEFVERADLWPARLPHVTRVALGQLAPGVQDLEMDTVTADGGAQHTTRSIRLCLPPDEIAYKQVDRPALLLGHSGAWRFSGRTASSRHTVAINPEAIAEVLGAHTTIAEAGQHLRRVLGANSRATLTHAGAQVTDRAPQPPDRPVPDQMVG